jgi:hypothetical protein
MIYYAVVALVLLAFGAFLVYLTRQNERIMARTLGQYSAPTAQPEAPRLPNLPAVFYQDDAPRRYPQQAAPVSYAAPEIVTQTPTGTARSLQSDVAVPMAQAGFSGVVGAILAGGVAANLHAENVLSWALAGFALGLAGVWALNLWQSHRLLWKVEKIVGRSLDGDPFVGEPPDSGHVLLVNPDKARAQVAQAQAETARRVKTSDLLTFWTRCHTQGTAQRAHGIDAGSGVAFDRYNEMRDTLLRLGLAEWRNPASPKAGWRVVGDMAEGGALLAKHVKEQRHST